VRFTAIRAGALVGAGGLLVGLLWLVLPVPWLVDIIGGAALLLGIALVAALIQLRQGWRAPPVALRDPRPVNRDFDGQLELLILRARRAWRLHVKDEPRAIVLDAGDGEFVVLQGELVMSALVPDEKLPRKWRIERNPKTHEPVTLFGGGARIDAPTAELEETDSLSTLANCEMFNEQQLPASLSRALAVEARTPYRG